MDLELKGESCELCFAVIDTSHCQLRRDLPWVKLALSDETDFNFLLMRQKFHSGLQQRRTGARGCHGKRTDGGACTSEGPMNVDGESDRASFFEFQIMRLSDETLRRV